MNSEQFGRQHMENFSKELGILIIRYHLDDVIGLKASSIIELWLTLLYSIHGIMKDNQR